MKARVIVASTRAATGIYEDTGGPILKRGLEEIGCEVDEVVVVADGEPVRQALVAALDSKPDVIVTTGGTGISPTDKTPDVTRAFLDYEVPGIADAIRRRGATPLAALSTRTGRSSGPHTDRELAGVDRWSARWPLGAGRLTAACGRATKGR